MTRTSSLVEETLARYGAITHRALLRFLPAREPRRYLYDLVADYPLRGSKMLRSSLCIAVCRAFGGEVEDALNSAVAMELLHNAFLIHDDIEDGSELRRGRPALHIQHGVPLALNVGDAMTMLSLEPLIHNRDVVGPALALQILLEMQTVVKETVEGQAMELGWRRDNLWDVSPDDYLRMVLKKTCWYTCIYPCRAGAMLGARQFLDPSFAVSFGLLLGAVFQIQDDILNVAGASARYGKLAGDDIFEGKRTLLLIHLMERLDANDTPKLLHLLGLPREQRDPDQIAWVIDQMHALGSVDYARAHARGLADAASGEFDRTFGGLPECEDKHFIRGLIAYMLERDA